MVTPSISSLKPEHRVFAEQMMLHDDKIQAYMKAYPKATKESARVKSYALLRNVTIVTLIEEAKKRRHEKIERVVIQGEMEAEQMGIRSKHERILILQNLVELSLMELQSNIGDSYYLKNKQVVKYQRPLTPFERSTIRKTIRELQAEISKIEGDYAPLKTANTKADGSDADIPSAININVLATSVAITNQEE